MTVTLGKPQVCAPQGIGYTDVIDTTPHQYRQMVWQAQLRTQVITRAPFQSSEASIRISLAEQWCASTNSYIGNEVEDIFRDELDKRRFYIRYRTYQLRRQIAGNGFTIGTTQIPAEPAIFYGMIPKVPPRLTIQIMTTILKHYGELHDVYYETYPDTSVSTRRLFFSYSKVNNQVPESIEVDGITLFIRDRRARKQCTKCEKYGHTVGWCTIKDEGDSPPIISEAKEETSTFSPEPRRKKKKKKKKSKTTPTTVEPEQQNQQPSVTPERQTEHSTKSEQNQQTSKAEEKEKTQDFIDDVSDKLLKYFGVSEWSGNQHRIYAAWIHLRHPMGTYTTCYHPCLQFCEFSTLTDPHLDEDDFLKTCEDIANRVEKWESDSESELSN